MLWVEKTVFISYREGDIARSIYEYLQSTGYDVLFDKEMHIAGDFSQLLLQQIKRRAHFVLILTPSTLEGCADPQDRLRREIETAIDAGCNIIPLLFDQFEWESVKPLLVGKIAKLKDYVPLRIYTDYFNAGMERLRVFLNVETPKKRPVESADVLEGSIPITVAPRDISENSAFMWLNFSARPINVSPIQKFRIDPQQETHPTDLAYQQLASNIRMRQQNDVITKYTKIINDNVNDATAYLKRGWAYYKQREYDRAIADYDSALQLMTRNLASIYHNRGLAYYGKEDYDRAIADYTHAINYKPDYVNAYTDRGNAYYKQREYDRAIADYTRALEINPREENAYTYRGNAYHKQRDYDRAIADYTRALEINPRAEKAEINLARAQRAKNQPR